MRRLPLLVLTLLLTACHDHDRHNSAIPSVLCDDPGDPQAKTAAPLSRHHHYQPTDPCDEDAE